LQKTIKTFRQDLDDNLTPQLSIRLFLGIRCRDIPAFLVCQGCDLLNSIIKADDLQLDSRVANQLKIG